MVVDNNSIGLSRFYWWTSTAIEVHHQKIDFVIDPAAGDMIAAKVDHCVVERNLDDQAFGGGLQVLQGQAQQ